jgi:hypothetical protein
VIPSLLAVIPPPDTSIPSLPHPPPFSQFARPRLPVLAVPPPRSAPPPLSRTAPLPGAGARGMGRREGGREGGRGGGKGEDRHGHRGGILVLSCAGTRRPCRPFTRGMSPVYETLSKALGAQWRHCLWGCLLRLLTPHGLLPPAHSCLSTAPSLPFLPL